MSLPDPPTPPDPTRDPPASRPSRDLLFAVAGAAIFAVVAGVTASRHELWRDEMNAWLIARDSASPLDVLRSIRYDGHPASWYLILWPLARLAAVPAAMQVANVAIATAASFLVLRFAPGARWMRALWVLGYFPLYEYGVISRNYALSVLALAALACAFPRRHERPLLVGLLVALAAQTSPHGLFTALAIALVLASERVLRPPGPGERPRAWAGIAIAFVGIALTAWQIQPPPDGAYGGIWRLGADAARAQLILGSVVNAYLPVPVPGPGFWQTNAAAAVLSPAGLAALGALLLAGAAAAMAHSRVGLACFATSSLGLLAFGYLRFEGYLRHHGFLWLSLGFAAWIGSGGGPARGETGGWLRRAGAIAFATLLGVHVLGAGIAVVGEHRLRFSAAGATADLLRASGADRLPLAGAWDYTAMNVLGHLGARRAFYLNGRRQGSYVIYDRQRTGFLDAWSTADWFVGGLAGPATVVLDASVLREQPPPPWLAHRIAPIGCEASEVVADEGYCAFVLWPPGGRR